MVFLIAQPDAGAGWMLGAVPVAVQLVGVVLWAAREPSLADRAVHGRNQDPQNLPMGDVTPLSASLGTRLFRGG